MAVSLPWWMKLLGKGFMTVEFLLEDLSLGTWEFRECLSLHLLFVRCLQFKIISIQKWHIWGGIFCYPACSIQVLFCFAFLTFRGTWRAPLGQFIDQWGGMKRLSFHRHSSEELFALNGMSEQIQLPAFRGLVSYSLITTEISAVQHGFPSIRQLNALKNFFILVAEIHANSLG